MQKLTLPVTGIIRACARHPYLNGLLNRVVREAAYDISRRIKASVVEPLIAAQRRIIKGVIAAREFGVIDLNPAYFPNVGACHLPFDTRVSFGGPMGAAQSQDAFV